jgi:hypothetical protein
MPVLTDAEVAEMRRRLATNPMPPWDVLFGWLRQFIADRDRRIADAPSLAKPNKPSSPYLDVEMAGEYLRVSAATLAKLRTKGNGPRFRKHGDKIVYKVRDLDDWSDSRALLATVQSPAKYRPPDAQ